MRFIFKRVLVLLLTCQIAGQGASRALLQPGHPLSSSHKEAWRVQTLTPFGDWTGAIFPRHEAATKDLVGHYVLENELSPERLREGLRVSNIFALGAIVLLPLANLAFYHWDIPFRFDWDAILAHSSAWLTLRYLIRWMDRIRARGMEFLGGESLEPGPIPNVLPGFVRRTVEDTRTRFSRLDGDVYRVHPGFAAVLQKGSWWERWRLRLAFWAMGGPGHEAIHSLGWPGEGTAILSAQYAPMVAAFIVAAHRVDAMGVPVLVDVAAGVVGQLVYTAFVSVCFTAFASSSAARHFAYENLERAVATAPGRIPFFHLRLLAGLLLHNDDLRRRLIESAPSFERLSVSALVWEIAPSLPSFSALDRQVIATSEEGHYETHLSLDRRGLQSCYVLDILFVPQHGPWFSQRVATFEFRYAQESARRGSDVRSSIRIVSFRLDPEHSQRGLFEGGVRLLVQAFPSLHFLSIEADLDLAQQLFRDLGLGPGGPAAANLQTQLREQGAFAVPREARIRRHLRGFLPWGLQPPVDDRGALIVSRAFSHDLVRPKLREIRQPGGRYAPDVENTLQHAIRTGSFAKAVDDAAMDRPHAFDVFVGSDERLIVRTNFLRQKEALEPSDAIVEGATPEEADHWLRRDWESRRSGESLRQIPDTPDEKTAQRLDLRFKRAYEERLSEPPSQALMNDISHLTRIAALSGDAIDRFFQVVDQSRGQIPLSEKGVVTAFAEFRARHNLIGDLRAGVRMVHLKRYPRLSVYFRTNHDTAEWTKDIRAHWATELIDRSGVSESTVVRWMVEADEMVRRAAQERPVKEANRYESASARQVPSSRTLPSEEQLASRLVGPSEEPLSEITGRYLITNHLRNYPLLAAYFGPETHDLRSSAAQELISKYFWSQYEVLAVLAAADEARSAGTQMPPLHSLIRPFDQRKAEHTRDSAALLGDLGKLLGRIVKESPSTFQDPSAILRLTGLLAGRNAYYLHDGLQFVLEHEVLGPLQAQLRLAVPSEALKNREIELSIQRMERLDSDRRHQAESNKLASAFGKPLVRVLMEDEWHLVAEMQSLVLNLLLSQQASDRNSGAPDGGSSSRLSSEPLQKPRRGRFWSLLARSA